MQSFSILSAALLVAGAYAQEFSFPPAQWSSLDSLRSKLNMFSTVPGYPGFEAAAKTMTKGFYKTQTASIPTGTSDADILDAARKLESIYFDVIGDFILTQTYITGKPRETMVDVFDKYNDILREAYSRTGGSSGDGNDDTPSSTATESGAPNVSDEPGAASLNKVAGLLAGVVAGIMAGVAVL